LPIALTRPPKIKATCAYNEIYFLTEAQIKITITMPVFLVKHGKYTRLEGL